MPNDNKKPVASDLSVATCSTCRFWQPCPTQATGCEPQKICGLSRNVGFGLMGQDGRAVITPATFGCKFFEQNTNYEYE